MRVEGWLEASARRYPQKKALITDELQVTFAELDELANRAGNALRRRGVGRGDRVVVFMENSVEAVAALFGALKAGAVFSLVNPTTKAEKIAFILNNCKARALVAGERQFEVAAEAAEKAPSVTTKLAVGADLMAMTKAWGAWDAALTEAACERPAEAGIDIDLAMVIYTSGSTGFPKGVMMTHQNMQAASTSISTYLGNTPDDVVLSVLPLSFDYGLYQVLMGVQIGMTVVLEKGFSYPAVVLQKLERHRVTGFPLVPTLAAILLQLKDLVPGRFPDLRFITNTAAALPPAHIERLQALFPGTQIFSMYGLTECKRCTYLPPGELKKRPGSVGKAIPNTEAYVVDEKGDRAAAGMVGELVIRGGHVMKGYWENAEATDRMLRPGPYPWEKVLYTGDLFRTDDEGFLYFVGRKDDIIKTRGEKVSPKEIENVLYALRGVREAAVIGVPDAILGQAIKAVIVAEVAGSLSEQDVMAHCSRNLEDFMVPRIVEFRHTLPKTDTGKISRREVAES